jgi:hypothetical protein
MILQILGDRWITAPSHTLGSLACQSLPGAVQANLLQRAATTTAAAAQAARVVANRAYKAPRVGNNKGRIHVGVAIENAKANAMADVAAAKTAIADAVAKAAVQAMSTAKSYWSRKDKETPPKQTVDQFLTEAKFETFRPQRQSPQLWTQKTVPWHKR